MEFVAATNNAGKLQEIQRILAPYGHTVASLESVGIHELPPEQGQTFAENARAKAQAACDLCGEACIGDDSGLEVDALGGAPGVMSARFAGKHGDDAANNAYLMYLLERTPYAKRGAHFVCAVALAMPDGKLLEAEGRCDGRIGFAGAGKNGFGYDPLFYAGERSFADMTDEEKDTVSHRAKALQSLMAKLPGGAKPPVPPPPQSEAPEAAEAVNTGEEPPQE